MTNEEITNMGEAVMIYADVLVYIYGSKGIQLSLDDSLRKAFVMLHAVSNSSDPTSTTIEDLLDLGKLSFTK